MGGQRECRHVDEIPSILPLVSAKNIDADLPETITSSSLYIDHYKTVLSLLSPFCFDSIQIETAASMCGQSEFRFQHFFRKQTGMSFGAYSRLVRLLLAANALRLSPNMRVIDIAYEAGYDSHEAFTRAFARSFGISPSAYRSGTHSIEISSERFRNRIVVNVDALLRANTFAPRIEFIQQFVKDALTREGSESAYVMKNIGGLSVVITCWDAWRSL